MRLLCYPTAGWKPLIRPAPRERAWMGRTPEGFAYRCLPLTIANSHGWEILTPDEHVAVWNGGARTEDIEVRTKGEAGPRLLSHFGSGVLTFDVGCLFRTEPGYNLYVSGPVNTPKDGVMPLTGIVESDWIPASFTMNWLFTRPGVPVRFVAGEPFCFVFPVQRALVESVEPEIRSLADDPETDRLYRQWRDNRATFLADLPKPGSDAHREKWEKTYYRGILPSGEQGVPDHRIKLQVKPFRDPSGVAAPVPAAKTEPSGSK